MRLSPHLTLGELACKDGTSYPPRWIESRARPLAAAFERVRTLCGDRPIVVLSAYRTEAHNRLVRGARHSQHVQGRALDLRPPNGLSVEDLHNRVMAAAVETGSQIRGVGRYPTFVHMDIRPSLTLVHWVHGSRAAADVDG